MNGEINLPVEHGNAELKLGSGKCFTCRRKGGGLFHGEFDVELESDSKLPILLCGNCLLKAAILWIEVKRREEEDAEPGARVSDRQTGD